MDRVAPGVVSVTADYSSQGSGFIFDIEEATAFVATNHHVVEDADEIDVTLYDGQTYEALLLGWDAERDVAVLAICCSLDFVSLPWDSARPLVGTQVVAVGFPRGSISSAIATTGEVVKPDSVSTRYDFISHSAPLNPGNSGGPLFSLSDARVLGINAARGTQRLTFYSVPYQAIEKPMQEWRSQLVIAAAPTPPPQINFETVVTTASSFTVNEIRDPAQSRFTVEVGKRLVAIDVTQVGLIEDAHYSLFNFSLQDSDGYVYEPGGVGGVQPRFRSGSLTAQQRVRGWLTFEVPQTAEIESVLAQPAFYTSPGHISTYQWVVIADLTATP